jgi:hypothetical protein
MTQTVKTFLALILLCAVAMPLSADVLLMDAISENPANTPEGVPRPVMGQTMEQVEKKFGAPKKMVDAVGEPPIGRWVYEHYTVYFEHDRVITTVLHR